MNRQQLVILMVALAIAGAAGFYVSKNRQQRWQESSTASGPKLYEQFPLNDITQVSLTNYEGGVTLAKVNDQWVVKDRADFPANFGELGDFLRKVWELKVGQSIKLGPSQLSRLGLDPASLGTNRPTLVEFKDKDGKAVASLALGKSYTKGNDSSPYGGFPAGRYVMIPGQLSTACLVAEAFYNVNAKPETWLNKEFIKVEKIRAFTVTHAETTNSWSLSRTNETADWVLASASPAEELDKTKVSGLSSFLSYAQISDVETGKADADLGLDQPVKIALETFDGFKYELAVGQKEGAEDRFVRVTVGADLVKERVAGKEEKPEDKARLDKEFADSLKKQEEKLKAEQALGKWTYRISKWTLDAGLKNRGELFAEKKPADTSTNAAPETASPPLFEIPGVSGQP